MLRQYSKHIGKQIKLFKHLRKDIVLICKHSLCFCESLYLTAYSFTLSVGQTWKLNVSHNVFFTKQDGTVMQMHSLFRRASSLSVNINNAR